MINPGFDYGDFLNAMENLQFNTDAAISGVYHALRLLVETLSSPTDSLFSIKNPFQVETFMISEGTDVQVPVFGKQLMPLLIDDDVFSSSGFNTTISACVGKKIPVETKSE